MAREFKTPKTKKANVWRIEKGREAGRWGWEVQIVRKDGSVFRKAGTRSTEKDALSARDAAFHKFNQSGGTGGRQYTVQAWCEYCLSEGLTYVSRKTKYHYENWLKSRVYRMLGPIKLDELRTDTLKEFYNRLQQEDVPSAAVRVRTALNSCLTLALEEGKISMHVGRIAKLKRAERRGIDSFEDELPGKRLLTLEERDNLLNAAKDTDLYWVVFFGTWFGLRIGECLGLRWSDIDLAAKLVNVRRQSQRIPGEGKQFTELKTKNSRRSIPIPATLLEELGQAQEVARLTGQDLVSPNRVGNQATPQEVSVKFKALAKRAGINGQEGKPSLTHHDLRSTLLTFLANHANDGRGVTPAVLRAIAGHGKIDTTYRYYIQADTVDLQKAMNFVC